jgi:Spy/CpxP family protein refolding chaperone
MKLINKQTIVAALVGGVSALALTVGGVALAHGAAHGPHGKGGPWTAEKMEEHLSEMAERLDLSPAQEQQVRTIMEDAKSRAEEIKEMPRGKEKFVAFRDLRFATEDQIYANLSCEQRDELRLLKREHKVERMQQRFERHHGDSANTDQ